jgi:hypothetical protein
LILLPKEGVRKKLVKTPQPFPSLLSVAPFAPPPFPLHLMQPTSSPNASWDAYDSNVFVKYLPSDVNDASLRRLFSTCGRVVSAKVMVDKGNGLSLGFGYVHTYLQYLFISSLSNVFASYLIFLCNLFMPWSQILKNNLNLT